MIFGDIGLTTAPKLPVLLSSDLWAVKRFMGFTNSEPDIPATA